MALNEKIVTTFDKKYNSDDFTRFANELLVGMEPRGTVHYKIPNGFEDYIKQYRRIGKYTYNDGYEKIIDVIEVTLKRTSSVDRARTMQRNFVARYLNGAFGGTQRDAALVAFISEDENGDISPDWRFSFVKMDYKIEIIEDEHGNLKRKPSVELTPAKRFSFLVGELEDTHTAQKQLKNCLDKATIKKEKITLEDLTQAFDIEKVSKEFFAEYKVLYEKLRDELIRLYDTDKLIHNDFDVHNINIDDFAKKTLGQLVFLYFIQKKGWLGVPRDGSWGQGDPKFLRNLFNRKYGEYNNFFNDVLEHLFYEALASDRGEGAWFDKLQCRIPFLNGGLFEPINGYEYQKTDLNIDNNIFKEIFDTFDLYNFTVKEDEPLEKEVAIDPEMLGKVFENLLPENIRKGNGAFYTPREIVHYMCQESLINYLYNKVNTKEVELSSSEKTELEKQRKKDKNKESIPDNKEVFEEIISKDDISILIKKGDSTYSNKSRKIDETLPTSIIEHAPLLDNALANIKICDPAIGSGAFPVGMMNEVVRARVALSEYIGQPDRLIYNLKRNAIENSIYGVDIDAGAVEIAKLRFWLSLVVDEEDVQKIKPLPNLDYKIMQGNSLITSYEDIDFDEIVENYVPEEGRQIGLFEEKSKSVITSLKHCLTDFLNTPHSTRKGEIKQEIENLIIELVKTKFEEKAKIGKLDLKEAEEKIRNFAQNKEKRNFFPWKLFFADAFEQGGFDVVIGNPPYVDSEEMVRSMPKEREMYSTKFVSAKGNWDLFIIFNELALNISKNKGINSFIIPNKILATKYSEGIRNIFQQKKIIEIRDYSRINVFKEAAVYPIVYVLCNDETIDKSEVIMCKIDETYSISNKNIIAPSIFYQDILWDKYFQDDKLVSILIKVSKNKKIKEYSDLSVTAAATVNEAYKIKEILKDNQKYDTLQAKKFINSGTIDKYKILWGHKPMQYIKGSYKHPIVKKNDIKNINATRFLQAESSKIVIANMTREIEAYYDNGNCLAAKSTTIILGNIELLKYVIGILNSKLITFWYQINYNSLKMSGEALSFGSNEVGSIPIIETKKEIRDNIISLVDKIIELTQSDNFLENQEKQAFVKEYANQIDNIVYRIYGLAEDEILMIEPNRLLGFKFDKKPSAREIVAKIAGSKPSLMDNDREFCYIFDKLALNNGYNTDELPSYWTIGRSIYNFKQENEIKASDDAQTTSKLMNEVDLNNPILRKFGFDKPKPSIRKIVEKIAEYNESLLSNDRQLIELFDGIALTNGYVKADLPKYWTIIRATFDYKKELASTVDQI